MLFLVLIGAAGASPHIGELLQLCHVFDRSVLSCPVFFSRERTQGETLNRFSRFMAQTTCFRAMKCHLGIKTMGDVIWGKYAPNLLPLHLLKQVPSHSLNLNPEVDF